MTHFHIGDTVTFTNTEDNIADGIDGQDGRVVDTSGAVTVDLPDFYVVVLDSSGIALADCPHAAEEGEQ